MSLFFALILIGLPTLALFYDFYKGGQNTMLTPEYAAPQRMMAEDTTAQRTITERSE